MEKKKARLAEITQIEALDGFWQDTNNAAKIQKEKALLNDIVSSYGKVNELVDELEITLEYAENGDEDSLQNLKSLLANTEQAVLKSEQKALLSGETDTNNAIVSINAGAGGTESCDWASMLHRMITRWCETKGFKVSVLDYHYGETAGIKSITFTVEGAFAYGLLKSETGIHRLVRISPFDSNARRHTSFASVFVSPEIDDTIEIEIDDKDIRIDVYRSGGSGGQSVNTTDSAVRLTHFPSGIVVTCQNERSQLQNKLTAFKVLRSRLYEKAMEEKRAAQAKIEDTKMEIGWGSQIRSYVLHPYKLVKDHRTDFEKSTAENVLDGDLDDFIDNYLQWKAVEGKAAQE
ncbi:MAG: peptide chain release factor 2 [Bacteriovoracaceae bacterium]|nr:peptide chain release factor 2 [Bacteriovoracaceae bacterium]